MRVSSEPAWLAGLAQHDARAARLANGLDREPGGRLPGGVAERLRRWRRRLRHDDRIADVAALPDRAHQRDLTQERHAVTCRRPLSAAVAEDVGALPAAWADEVAHVLDDAQDGRLHFLEHRQALDRVGQGDILRRGDDDRAGERNALHQRQLDVTGSGRQVDDEVVELAPLDLVQESSDQLGDERAAPDKRAAGVEQEDDRHQLDAVGFERHDAVLVELRLVRVAHHHWNAGAVDVGIEQTDSGAVLCQRDGDIDGHRRLADAALAAGDRDRVLDTGKGLFVRQAGAARPHPGRELQADISHTGECHDRRLDVAIDRVPEGAGRRGQLNVNGYLAALDRDIFDHAELDQAAADLWVVDWP